MVEDFPDFCDYIEKVTDEFRMLKAFHKSEKPYSIPGKVAILTAWGKLRSWTCSGHFHENPTRDLIHILESLSGLPVEVEFLSFEDVVNKEISKDVKVIINAGCKDSAWSGGFYWKNSKVVEKINEWVSEGGCFIGVNEPSQIEGGFHTLQMSPVLGIDLDDTSKSCQGKFSYSIRKNHFMGKELNIQSLPSHVGVYLTDKETQVLAEKDGSPLLTVHDFGKGKGIYLAGYRYSTESTRLLLKMICYGSGQEEKMDEYICSNPLMECAYFAQAKKLIVINNGETTEETKVYTNEKGYITVKLAPYELEVITLN